MARVSGTGTSRGGTLMHGRSNAASDWWLYVGTGSDAPVQQGGGKKGRRGHTKHGKHGAHGRQRTPLPAEARRDPWHHKDQAPHQG